MASKRISLRSGCMRLNSMRLNSVLLTCLLCGMPLTELGANEPAYVDSPAGRSVADPARTDGHARAAINPDAPSDAGDAQTQQAYEDHAEAQRRMIEAQIAAVEQANAQRMTQALSETAETGTQGYEGPPVGGHDLGAELERNGISLRRPSVADETVPSQVTRAPGAGTQIRAGLLQDAAGLLDARIQRSVQGDDGTVMLPPGGP